MTLSARTRTRLDDEIERLRREGRPFAVATVVRTVDATSAKPGAKALVLADGTLAEGWVGGGCARAAVARAALEAMRAGAPQFVSLRPGELLEAEGVQPGDERAGVRFARNGCPSKGSMDIFIEPVMPLPRLIVFGAGPVALALAELAGRFDFFRMLCAPGPMPAPPPDVEALSDSFAPDAMPDAIPGAERFIVIATQGKGDAAALRAAIAGGADYIAFVGSRRKFAALSEGLRAEGVDPEALARVKAPAGLNIHAITPDEIALSILAQIIAIRRAGARA